MEITLFLRKKGQPNILIFLSLTKWVHLSRALHYLAGNTQSHKLCKYLTWKPEIALMSCKEVMSTFSSSLVFEVKQKVNFFKAETEKKWIPHKHLSKEQSLYHHYFTQILINQQYVHHATQICFHFHWFQKMQPHKTSTALGVLLLVYSFLSSKVCKIILYWIKS